MDYFANTTGSAFTYEFTSRICWSDIVSVADYANTLANKCFD
jgi:hypothetical protein